MIPALAIGGAWLIVAALIAPKIGRALKHADPALVPLEDLGEFTEIQRALPPVPMPRSWIDSVSVDCLSDCDPLLHERFAAIVKAESWFGGVL